MSAKRLVVLAAAVLTAASGSGCTTPKGPYGAEVFLRVSDTNGLPTYKAAGGEESPYEVINRACPDGNPQIVDGSLNFTASNVSSRSSYTVYFTCNHEIALDPSK